jgi:hypothetical protein
MRGAIDDDSPSRRGPSSAGLVERRPAKTAITSFVSKVTTSSASRDELVVIVRGWLRTATHPEQWIGSQGKLRYEVHDGKPILIELREARFVDDGPGKPAGVRTLMGRRPIAAFGNSDGDREMLEWTMAGTGPPFALDRALDQGMADQWTVVDVKKDWRRMFPFE